MPRQDSDDGASGNSSDSDSAAHGDAQDVSDHGSPNSVGNASNGSRQTSPKISDSPANSPELQHQDTSRSNHSRRSSSASDQGSLKSRVKSPISKESSGSDSDHNNNDGKKRKHQALSDSGSDSEKVQRVKKAVFGSDSETEAEKNPNVDAEALFGDADDISDDDSASERKKSSSSSEDEADKQSVNSKSSYHSPRRGSDDDEAESKPEAKEEPQPETIIDIEIPRVSCDLGKEFQFVKLPNFLSVDTKPFDAGTYEDEIDEEETLDEEGHARLKLKVENTIRWRQSFDEDGNVVKESNARFVRWSDGSLSLHLGSEIFDVYKQPLAGDFNHLFIRQGTGLQGQGVFRNKLTFRPYSTDSHTHKKMTMSLADRSTKISSIKIMGAVGADPDANRWEKIKMEEERLRAHLRLESKQRRMRERGAGRSLSSNFLEGGEEIEGSDDEGGISISAIKNRFKTMHHKYDRPHIYSTDDDASDVEFQRTKDKSKPKQALKDSEESDASVKESKVNVVSSESEASYKKSATSGSGSGSGSSSSDSD